MRVAEELGISLKTLNGVVKNRIWTNPPTALDGDEF
jgi:hypothetical protein